MPLWQLLKRANQDKYLEWDLVSRTRYYVYLDLDK